MRKLLSTFTATEVMLIATLVAIAIIGALVAWITFSDPETAFANHECNLTVSFTEVDPPPKPTWLHLYEGKGRWETCEDEARCRYNAPEDVHACMAKKGYREGPPTKAPPDPPPAPIPTLRDM